VLAQVEDVEALALVELLERPVVAASRYAQKPGGSPTLVSSIDAEQIEQLGYRTIGEALRSMHGVYLSDDRNYVHLGVRGFGCPATDQDDQPVINSPRTLATLAMLLPIGARTTLGELELDVQSKLLRSLELREVVPLGGGRPRRVTFGLCSATHESLRQLVAVRRFREDLFYRIGAPAVELPPPPARTAGGDSVPRLAGGNLVVFPPGTYWPRRFAGRAGGGDVNAFLPARRRVNPSNDHDASEGASAPARGAPTIDRVVGCSQRTSLDMDVVELTVDRRTGS
jgi:hypothetical protein